MPHHVGRQSRDEGWLAPVSEQRTSWIPVPNLLFSQVRYLARIYYLISLQSKPGPRRSLIAPLAISESKSTLVVPTGFAIGAR